MNSPKASVALRVGMHALAVLNRLMGFPPPNQELPLQRVQDALRDDFADFKSRQPEAWFMVLADGQNQATDPGDMLGALSDPLPDNLFVLASSHKQERVKGPLTLYGRQEWRITDMSQLAHAEAEAVVRRFWTRNIEGQKTPEWDQVPKPLRQKLYEKSNGLPIFLRDWRKTC